MLPGRRLFYLMHVTFDESSVPALLQIKYTFDDDNGVGNSSTYESSKYKACYSRKTKDDISNSKGGTGRDNLEERRDDALETLILDSLSTDNEISRPTTNAQSRRAPTKSR